MVSEVLQADIAPYRGIKVETQLLAQEPEPGRQLSETSDAALGTTTLAFANGTRVVLKPTTFKNDEVFLAGARYGGQYLYGQADHQNAVHLVSTIEAMGYGTLTPTALQRFQGTPGPAPAWSSLPTRRKWKADPRATTSDDAAARVPEAHSPRLDMARLASTHAALKGYLAGKSNSPMSQFEDFGMAVLSKDTTGATGAEPADLNQVNAERSVAMFRERFGNASGMTFVIVGSFSVAEVKPMVARYLGGLPSTPREAQFRDVGLRYPTGAIERTLQKGSDNSAVTVIYSGERPYSVVRSSSSRRSPKYSASASSTGSARSWARRIPPTSSASSPGSRRPVRGSVLGRLLPRRGSRRRAHDRRDHQGIAERWSDGRGTREGHTHLAQRTGRPHEDEPGPGRVGSALGRWIPPWMRTPTTSPA